MEEIRNAVEDGFNINPRKESPKCVYLFNCDKTYNLDSVETLLCVIKDDIRTKLRIDTQLAIRKNYFSLSKMSEMSETTIPKLQMDFAVFVVHAHESGLKINEHNAGTGYARLFRALLKATGKSQVESRI